MRPLEFAMVLLLFAAITTSCTRTRECDDAYEERDGECVPRDADAGRDAGPVDAGNEDTGPSDAGADACTRAWYRDQDMDDHGDPTTRVDACEMPAGYVATDDDCDDTDSAMSPSTAEVCDDIDQDCDDAIDETFPCRAGTLTMCTTTCGSMGSGTCSASCESAAPTSCMVPTEACNYADDDCDGIVDQGRSMFVNRHAYTRPDGSDMRIVDAAFGPVTIYRVLTQVYAQALSEEGLPVGGERVVATDAATAISWSAAGTDGGFVVFWTTGGEILGAEFGPDLVPVRGPVTVLRASRIGDTAVAPVPGGYVVAISGRDGVYTFRASADLMTASPLTRAVPLTDTGSAHVIDAVSHGTGAIIAYVDRPMTTGRKEVRVARLDSSGALDGTAITVSDPLMDAAHTPALALDDAGGVLGATWLEQSGSSYGLVFARFDPATLMRMGTGASVAAALPDWGGGVRMIDTAFSGGRWLQVFAAGTLAASNLRMIVRDSVGVALAGLSAPVTPECGGGPPCTPDVTSNYQLAVGARDGRVFLGAVGSGTATRTYLYGCGPP